MNARLPDTIKFDARPGEANAPPILSVTPVPAVSPVERSTVTSVALTRTVISYQSAVTEPVPPETYIQFPTTSVPKLAVADVIVVVPFVTPSVTEY